VIEEYRGACDAFQPAWSVRHSIDRILVKFLEGRYGLADLDDSAIQYLEQKLAELETLSTTTENVTNAALPTHDDLRIDAINNDVLQIAGISVMRCLSTSGFECSDKIQHKAKLFYGSERPPLKIPIGGFYYERSPRTAGYAYLSQFAQFNARKIPKHVAKRLLENYKMDILPRFPCFEENEIEEYFNFFHEQELSNTNNKDLATMANFAVPMVLAICSLTSRNDSFEKVAALSEALQSDAFRHVEPILQHTSIQSLQCMLLIIQLAVLLPNTANLWHSTGEAMRVAVSLGLHQEPDDRTMKDCTVCEERRKIFWVSEIHATQFFDQALPDYVNDHADWVNKTTEAVQKLANEVTSGSLVDPWLISAPYQCRVLLHRPCSRNIVVSDESLLAVVIAATNLIALDMNVAKAGGLVMAFKIGNRGFQAGMVLLYALRNHSARLEEASLTAAAETALSDLVQLFMATIGRTAAYINELQDTNLRNPIGRHGSTYDMNVLEELDCLVTQRRIHSIRHRNVPLPQENNPATAAKPTVGREQMGENLFEDDNWWRDFINDDLVMNDSPFSLATSTDRTNYD
ncbi:C6 transcription factor, partial [Colletotrichum kahawae]